MPFGSSFNALGLQSGQLHEDTGFAEGGGQHWSMTTLRDKKDRKPKVVRHGRYVTFHIAEVAMPPVPENPELD